MQELLTLKAGSIYSYQGALKCLTVLWSGTCFVRIRPTFLLFQRLQLNCDSARGSCRTRHTMLAPDGILVLHDTVTNGDKFANYAVAESNG
jgi:hypothetical protein